MIKPPSNLRSFESLVDIVQALRHPTMGCPWDLEQTHKSLTPHLIEEAFECVEAIESNNREFTIEELGDVLLQPILHGVIAEQNKYFELMDVIEALNKKLVYRHSHVFSDASATNANEAITNWERMKAKEKEGRPQKSGFDIPVQLPSLQRAQKIGAKTKKFNFDWSTPEQVFDKVTEELNEVLVELQSLRQAASSEAKSTESSRPNASRPTEIAAKPSSDSAIAAEGNTSLKERLEAEIGDLLFSVAQLARHTEIDAESALRKANLKFENRFFKMKALAESRGLDLKKMSTAELEDLWSEIKRTNN